METEKRKTSLRLSPQAKRLLEELAKHLGVSQAAVIEMSIREFAEQRKREPKLTTPSVTA